MKVLHHLAGLLVLSAIGITIYFFLFSPVAKHQARLHKSLAATQIEISRLQDRITELQSFAHGSAFPEGLARSAANANAAEIALQDTVVQLSQAQGLNLMSFGSAGLRQNHKTPAVAVSLEGSGSLQDLYSFLAELEAGSPPIAVSQLRIRAGQLYGQDVTGQPIAFHTTLWSFWEPQDG